MASVYADFKFHCSCDVGLDVKVFVSQLQLPAAAVDAAAVDAASVYVSAQVVAGGLPMHATTQSTALPDVRPDGLWWNVRPETRRLLWLWLCVKTLSLLWFALLVRNG